MKEKFEYPEMDFIMFDSPIFTATSCTMDGECSEDEGCENEMPW